MAEPIFRGVDENDAEVKAAHARASATISQFRDLVRAGGEAQFMAKLRFRDPDLSDQTRKDQFFFLWLSEVVYHPEERIFSGVFFEVPEGFDKYHPVGQRLGFDPEDVFDWMVNENGHLRGGFTIRVTRARLKTEEEKNQYDEYIGVSSYEPIGN